MASEPVWAQGTGGPRGLKRKDRREFQRREQREGEFWSERQMLLSHNFKNGANVSVTTGVLIEMEEKILQGEVEEPGV